MPLYDPPGSHADAVAPSDLDLAQVAAHLRCGGVVGLPTDTVYGLAASLDHPAALRRIFEIKGRSEIKSLPILLASSAELAIVSSDVDPRLLSLTGRYWPGPLTVVVAARTDLPAEVTTLDRDGRPTVGVRVPAHDQARTIIAVAGAPATTNSANRSGRPPATAVSDARAALPDASDVLFVPKDATGVQPSSVVTLDNGGLVVLREGVITEAELRMAWSQAASDGHVAR